MIHLSRAIRESIRSLREALNSEHLTPYAESRIRHALLNLENALRLYEESRL